MLILYYFVLYQNTISVGKHASYNLKPFFILAFRFSGSVAVKDCWGFMLPGSHVAAEARYASAAMLSKESL